MLKASRRVGEKIIVGDDVVIVVSKINKNQVTIGIDAPESVKVYRQELYDKIQGVNE